MSFYSKITLLALLATGIISACEHPGSEPLETARKEVQQAAEFILFTHEGAVLARVPKKCMAANPEFMSLCSEFQSSTEHQKNQKELFGDRATTVELAGDVLEAFNLVKDYIVLDYELGLNLTIDNQAGILIIKEALNKKSEQELITIINATQLCNLNHLSRYVASLLATKLNEPARQKECLRIGSYNLQWHSDIAKLVAQEMMREKKPVLLLALFLEEQIRKYGKSFCAEIIDQANPNFRTILIKADSNSKEHFRLRHLFIPPSENNRIKPSFYHWVIHFFRENESTMHSTDLSIFKFIYSLTFNPDSAVVAVAADFREFIGEHPATIPIPTTDTVKYLNNTITPEQVALIRYTFETNKFYYSEYPGIEIIRETLPECFQRILYDDLYANYFSTTTKVGAGLGVAGIAAYCAYKWYYGKE